MTTMTDDVTVAASEAAVQRIGMNLEAFREADWKDPSVHVRFAALFAVNLDELLAIIDHLTRPV